MIKVLSNLIVKYSLCLASIALLTSTFVTDTCKSQWYQDKEPEGLAEFAKIIRQ